MNITIIAHNEQFHTEDEKKFFSNTLKKSDIENGF
jgi:hypothetical protein